MRSMYHLPIWLRRMKLPRSNFYYQIKAFITKGKNEYGCADIV